MCILFTLMNNIMLYSIKNGTPFKSSANSFKFVNLIFYLVNFLVLTEFLFKSSTTQTMFNINFVLKFEYIFIKYKIYRFVLYYCCF